MITDSLHCSIRETESVITQSYAFGYYGCENIIPIIDLNYDDVDDGQILGKKYKARCT